METVSRETGVSMATLERWRAEALSLPSGKQIWKAADGLVRGDRRPDAVRETPAHALSAAERARLQQVANEPRFPDVPPARIVPMLADEGIYLASESSFHRVLRAAGQHGHRGRAKAPQAKRPSTTHVATAPNQVWCWDSVP